MKTKTLCFAVLAAAAVAGCNRSKAAKTEPKPAVEGVENAIAPPIKPVSPSLPVTEPGSGKTGPSGGSKSGNQVSPTQKPQ